MDYMFTFKSELNRFRRAYNANAALRESKGIEEWKKEERDRVLRSLRKKHIERMLEIGAGPGRDSLFFSRNGLKMTAVDMSEEMVRWCLEKGLNARVMDFYRLDFADGSFE